jgi:hypothetical protein
MSCAHAIAAFHATAAYVRKAEAGKRFDREGQAEPLEKKMGAYWSKGTDAMFQYLSLHDAWAKIQRQVQLRHAASQFSKAQFAKSLSKEDIDALKQLLSGFRYYDDVDKVMHEIIADTSFETFTAAAEFALKQIGLSASTFELKDENIRRELMDRTSAGIFATRNNIETTFETIIEHFYELGQNPYNSEFLADLKRDLGFTREYQAKRFALTETGIAAEKAQAITYRRNGVTGKQWNITGDNTRPTHEELAGVVIAMEDKFDVGGNAGDHPLDPSLPAEELVNCHCWLSPVVDDDYQLDPTNVWEGQ